jgi:hypothetical protein
MLAPVALIEVGETEDVGFNFFDSFPVNFDFKIMVETKEANKSIPAKDCSYIWITATLKAVLEPAVSG